MVKLICQRENCKYCDYHECKNNKIKDDFKNIKTVSEVLLSISSNSCSEFKVEEGLCDPHS